MAKCDWIAYDYYNLDNVVNKYKLKPCDIKYLKDIVNTKISMFSYKNLPGDLTSQILETSIMYRGHLCFYKLNAINEIALCIYVDSGEYDIYMKPTMVDLYALNGKCLATQIPYKDIILVRDNIMDIIPFTFVSEYIQNIRNIEKAMFNVLRVAQLPMFIVGGKNTAAQYLKLIKKIMDIDGFAVGDPSLVQSIQSAKIDVPISIEEIYSIKDKYRNECLSALGVYAVDQKRERIVTQELENQNDFTNFTYQGCLMERERFVKECNEKYGTDIQLVEIYDKNFKEDAKLNAYKVKQEEDAKASAEIEVEKEAPNGK